MHTHTFKINHSGAGVKFRTRQLRCKIKRSKTFSGTHICSYLKLAGPAGDQSQASDPRSSVRQRRGRPPRPTAAPNSLGLRAGTPCSTTPHLHTANEIESRAPDFCTLTTTHWQDWCRGRRLGWQRRWGCPALHRRWRLSSAACRRLPSFAKVASPSCRRRRANEPSGCRTRLVESHRIMSALKVLIYNYWLHATRI